MVRLPINVLPTSGQLFPIIFFLSISIDQLDKTDAPLIPEAYINLLGIQYPVLFSNSLTGHTVPLKHPRSPKTTHGLKPSPYVHPASADRATNSARDAERSWGPSLLLNTSLSKKLHFW